MEIRTRWERPARGPLVGAIVVAALMVFVVPTGVAGAAPAAATGSSASIAWAYGAVNTITFSGTSHSGVPYTGNATYGYTVSIHQTNSTVTPHEFELTVARTMGASFAVEYRYPSCRAPTYHAELSARVWETVNSTAYLIDNGNVYENGAPVPAFALLNASTLQVANESESTSSYLPLTGGMGGMMRAGYLGAEVTANAAVAFATPLGLFPTALSTSQSWNSTAPFRASVEATYDYLAAHKVPAATGALRGNGTIPVEGSGTVNLSGSYSTGNSIDLGGAHYSEVSLSLLGPFTLQEGFIVVPVASDLFQGANEPWSSNQSGAATAGMSFVDLRAAAADHFGLGASRWLYDSSSLEPTDAAPAPGGFTELAGTGAPDTAPATVVQGEPQTGTQSQSTQTCLLTGAGCPSSGSVPGLLHGLVGLLAVGAVVVAALAVAVVVVERRRVPPPSYPNAALYPPGTSGGPVRAPGPSPPPPAAPEEDPLSNLW